MAEKLRILFVLHFAGHGGSEMVVHRIIRGLPSADFDFSVVSLISGGSLADVMKREGVRLYSLGHKVGINPGLILKLRRIIHEERPDIVNTHHVAPLLYTWLARLTVVRRPPLIHTVHVLPELHGRHATLGMRAVRLYHFLLKRADHVVCVSHGERERLIEVPGLLPHRVTAIPNGVDVEKFHPSPPLAQLRSELGVAPETAIITNIGAFRTQKNQPCLVEAFRRVRLKHENAVLLLVGGLVAGDPTLETTQALVKSLNLEGAVRLLGPRPDVLELLALTDVYVQSSLYEGLPLSVQEAMAMGRAVVATDVIGNNELIHDGITGLLVPPGDPEALCQAILRLLADPSLRASLGAAAREFVSKDYSLSGMIEKYNNLFCAMTTAR